MKMVILTTSVAMTFVDTRLRKSDPMASEQIYHKACSRYLLVAVFDVICPLGVIVTIAKRQIYRFSTHIYERLLTNSNLII